MKESEFYLTSPHGNLGSNVSFHGKTGGYTTDITNLEVITAERAAAEVANSNDSLPLLKSAVDALGTPAIDHQYIDSAIKQDPDDQYILWVTQCWDGNDIAFVTAAGQSYNYAEATVFTYVGANEFMGDSRRYVILPKSHLDTLTRIVFKTVDINVHTMIRRAGVQYTTPRKPRPISGKTRLNCGGCGRLFWDHNPEEEMCSAC